MVMLGHGTPYRELALETKRGRQVPNSQKPERASEAREAALRLWKDEHPEIRIRSCSATYNCVGMVFAARRTCVDAQHVRTFLEDDGYRMLDDQTDLRPGDVVVYKRDESPHVQHVGVVVWRTRLAGPRGEGLGHGQVWVVSQWGLDLECLHYLTDVPDIYGRPSEFWTDRVMP